MGVTATATNPITIERQPLQKAVRSTAAPLADRQPGDSLQKTTAAGHTGTAQTVSLVEAPTLTPLGRCQQPSPRVPLSSRTGITAQSIDAVALQDGKISGQFVAELKCLHRGQVPDPAISSRLREYADPLDPQLVALVNNPDGLTALMTAGDLASLRRRVALATSPAAQRQFADTVAAASGKAAVTEGNAFQFHLDGPDAYKSVHQIIQNAHTTLDMEFYEFHDDEQGWKLAHEVVDRVKAGVTVNLLLDEMHALQHQPIVDYLRANGVNLRLFNNGYQLHKVGHKEMTAHPWDTTDHRKVILADGKAGMTGGMNLGTCYTHWHDSMTSVQGPILQEMYQQFAQNWQRAGGEAPTKSLALAAREAKPVAGSQVLASVAVTRPGQEDYLTGIKKALAMAKDHVNVQMPYLSDPELLDALCATADRGVRVEVSIPNFDDSKAFDSLHRAVVNQLIDHGVDVRFCESRNAPGLPQDMDNRPFAHLKAITIDGIFAAVGSTNADGRSLRRNQEMSVFVTSPDLALDIDRRLFQHDKLTGRAVSADHQGLLDIVYPDYAANHPKLMHALNGGVKRWQDAYTRLTPTAVQGTIDKAGSGILRWVGQKL